MYLRASVLRPARARSDASLLAAWCKVDLSGACMQGDLISSAPPFDLTCLMQLPDPLSPAFMPFSVTASASVVAAPTDAPVTAGGGRRLMAAAEALPEPADTLFCSECAAACHASA